MVKNKPIKGTAFGLCKFIKSVLLFFACLGIVGSSPRSSDLVKLAQECCYHNNRGIAAHGVRVLTNITVSCQEKGKFDQDWYYVWTFRLEFHQSPVCILFFNPLLFLDYILFYLLVTSSWMFLGQIFSRLLNSLGKQNEDLGVGSAELKDFMQHCPSPPIALSLHIWCYG